MFFPQEVGLERPIRVEWGNSVPFTIRLLFLSSCCGEPTGLPFTVHTVLLSTCCGGPTGLTHEGEWGDVVLVLLLLLLELLLGGRGGGGGGGIGGGGVAPQQTRSGDTVQLHQLPILRRVTFNMGVLNTPGGDALVGGEGAVQGELVEVDVCREVVVGDTT